MTLAELSKQIGYSTATLDRVVNNRGMVSEKTRKEVLKRIEELNFEVNHTGKTLAMQKKLRFGVIISSDLVTEENRLFSRIYDGMRAGERELAPNGAKFVFRFLESGSAEDQVKAINELVQMGITRIALSLEEKSEVLDRAMQEASHRGVEFIVYFNAVSSDNLFERFDYHLNIEHTYEGYLAAKLLTKFMAGRGKVLLISGMTKNQVHQTRIDSAYSQLEQLDGIEVVEVVRDSYPNEKTEQQLEELFYRYPDITGIISSCGSNWLIADWLEKKGLRDKVTHISFDFTSKIQRYLEQDKIDGVIGVDLGELGYNTTMVLYDSLVLGTTNEYKRNLPVQIGLGGCYHPRSGFKKEKSS